VAGPPGREQDLLVPSRIGPFLLQWPSWALHPVDLHLGEAALADLAGQAGRGVEVSRGEVLRPSGGIGVAVLSFGQVPVDDGAEDRVVEPVPVQPIE